MAMTQQNWSYSFFKHEQNKAFISFCAQPADNTEEVTVLYAITVVDGDDNEIFQQSYVMLSEALNQINQRYKQWDYYNLSERSDSNGCATCSAH